MSEGRADTMRKWVIGVIGLLALGGIVACVIAAQGGAGARPAPPTATAAPAPVTAEGIVVPERQARLAFKQAGRVTSVRVDVGKRVQAGEVLATLEATEANLAIR